MNYKDNCDIIIEKILKEFNSMDNTSKEKWEVPKYTGSQINKAGRNFVNPNSTAKEKDAALEVINNWRASHAYPLQIICSNLRRNNPNAIVVQRLKRLDSIINKLNRNKDHVMELYRMQDLGGCRVIVDSIDDVYKAVDKYKTSSIRHILKKEYDYIKCPKESGYRSYHMVYKFCSDSKETYNKNMLIEIQFRTRLQHIWATAVEMMGIYTKSNLKASQGNDEILRFFTLVSSVFAAQEKMPLCPNTSQWADELIVEIEQLDKKHNILSTLSAINVTINYTSELKIKGKNLYYLLILNYSKKNVRVRSFNSSQIEVATKIYDTVEKESNLDAVLVSATSFETLKLAYPNYFVDISAFIDNLRDIINFYKSLME
jgi:ppGpp synthetase/RelA/SpoT-type nucleotidyltranferase|uniref:RelA/SpoT domain-containing protein n=1 Tax=Siphoviridae sp. ctEkS11 TaxID=2827272 RepID=A0A8S5R4M7_9CAUD|nr:MAG TPA: hypothetical protein [Siphoviridae sp. ctEkS11]